MKMSFDLNTSRVRSGVRMYFFSGCRFVLCLFFFFNANAADTPGTDSLTHIEATPFPSPVNDNVYDNPDYFSNIPVEKTDRLIDTVAVRQSFLQMDKKYQSSDFNYDDNRVNRLSWWDRLKRNIKEFLISLAPKLRIDLRKTFYFILVAIGVLALAYVIYRLVVNGKKTLYKEDAESKEHTPDWIEKNLMDINLETHLEQAITDKNYRLAVRYLHLINLQKLAQTGQIEWNIQKTNHEFLDEIKNHDLTDDFSTTIIVYEYIWYGGFEVPDDEFQKYQELFNDFKVRITKKQIAVSIL